MLQEIRTGNGDSRGQLISIAAHGILLALLIGTARYAWQIRPAVGRGGEQSPVLYWDDSVGAGAARTHSKEKSMPAKAHRARALKAEEKQAAPAQQQPSQAEAASAAGSSTSQSQNSGVGDGTQNATPAFPVYSPSPHLDKLLLPKTDENVVVDVSVSAMGQV